jgi:hypothetical protein
MYGSEDSTAMPARPSGNDRLVFKSIPAENTVRAHYKDQRLNAGHRDDRCLLESHTKHINTMCI